MRKTNALPVEAFTASAQLQAQERKPAGAASAAAAESSQLRDAVEDSSTKKRSANAAHSRELVQFIYATSHDLREPLRMISCYAELLKNRCGPKFDEAEREFMAYILDAAQGMDQFLTDLQTYAHHLRPFERPLLPVDPDAVLQSVIMVLDNEIRESGARITQDGFIKVRSDFANLAQVFRQLVSNSLKFRGPQPPEIHIACSESEDEVTLSFRDNGVGIPAAYHQDIFEPFRRLHGRDYPGSGLGLAVCRQIIAQHGGRIWVESTPGEGALFQFTLPQ